MPLELNAALRAFAAVAREGSFSRAANALLLSQPAISRQVATLEHEVGVRLIERNWRRTSLTPPGEVLAEHVLQAEALLAQGERRLRALIAGIAGSLSVAASGTPANYVLPGLVAAFNEQYPAVSIELIVGTSGETSDAVRHHRAEIGFVGGMAAAPELSTRALIDDQIVLVGSPERFPPGEPVSADDLGELAWIEREEGSATRVVTEAALSDIGFAPRRRVVLPGWEMVKLAVGAGAGVAALSRLAIDVELRAGTLRVLDVPGWRVTRHLSVITARGTRLTPAAARFLELVEERVGRLAGGSAPVSVDGRAG